jgi:hypothetical protein
MALVATITAKTYGPIGLVGQSPGFVDFTPAELASDGHIQTITRTFSFDSKTELAAITDVATGMIAIVDKTETDVTTYLATVFTDVAKAYDAKIYILNVRRVSDAIAGVASIDTGSPYVERDDFFYIDVKMNVSVV